MTENIYQKIGERIHQLREYNNLSQEELARLLGNYSASSISYFENGQRKIKIEEIMKLAKIFHVKLDDLLKDDDLIELNEEATRFRSTLENKSQFDNNVFEKDYLKRIGLSKIKDDI